MKNLAIIPARSGSKGLIDKNIKELMGKPLIAYTIEAAKESECFCNIIVSTDSEEYAEIAKQYGAEVPFLRDTHTATDEASSWDVVREVLQMYKERNQEFDAFALLQPTSPLRTKEDIITGFERLEQLNAEAIVSVCEAEHSMNLYNTLPEDLSLVGFLKNSAYARRQDFEKVYRLNGALYISKTKHFYEKASIYDSKCYAMIMSRINSIDIDTQEDFEIAECLMMKYRMNK